jgi:hypothetical protein
MHIEQLVIAHPRLYHMAEADTWDSIQQRGLLSTAAIVDLYDLSGEEREVILHQVRKRSITLDSIELGKITIRDQLPLKFLAECLTADTTSEQFLEALNGRVFFWLGLHRLITLLRARQYRSARQTVLTLDTAKLLEAYAGVAELAPYNTGSMHVPTAPRRGKAVFQAVADYPYDEWRKKRGSGADAVVELTIPYAVPDIAKYVLKVEIWQQGVPVEVLFEGVS